MEDTGDMDGAIFIWLDLLSVEPEDPAVLRGLIAALERGGPRFETIQLRRNLAALQTGDHFNQLR